MDYISKKIKERISFVRTIGNNNDLLTLHQSLLEYYLIYALGILWNNINGLDDEEKEYLYKKLLRPTIGDIASMIRKLDIDRLVGADKRVNQLLDNYPCIRNQVIGHGYTYSDGVETVVKDFETICDEIQNSKVYIYDNNIDLISVLSKDTRCYKGLNYKSDGSIVNWSCPVNSENLEVNCIYALLEDNRYIRISPFVEIDDFGNALFVFNSIEEKLFGRIKYNKLLSTGVKKRDWDEIAHLCVVNDGSKIKTSNGTIINVFDKNYTTFIGDGIKQKVKKFLLKNQSSVCATIWGHGGVGKTATVQSVCEDLANSEKKVFDYILFLSAKDRYYNTYTGNIEQLSDSITTYQQLICKVNMLIFGEQSTDEEGIIDYDGKLLLIIDDYETFPKEDREKIECFIQELNTNHHKVLITTRATSINIGLQLPSNELEEKQAIEFLLHLVENGSLGDTKVIEQQLANSEIAERFYKITSGRPLFIYQFANIMAKRGLKDALNFPINEQRSAIEFLYGRLYDYLSPKAKDVFVVLCLLVDEKNPVNVIDKAKYILNMESDADGFKSAVQELEKLKIIRYDFDEEDNRFFEVYSSEILQKMNEYYQNRDSSFKGACNRRREQVNRDKSLDVEHSLLLSANSNRVNKNEIEVVENYRQILNRPTAPIDIKLSAILNLASYLVIDRGKREQALTLFDEYSYLFSKIPSKDTDREKYAQYTKMWATYNWSFGDNDQRDKAVEILLTYAQSGFNYSKSYDLELAGLLLQYYSIEIIEAWQDLKEKRQYDEISYPEFKEKRAEQYSSCGKLHRKYGFPLYKSICNNKLSEYSSGARQNIVAGFYNYADILVRINEFDLATEICQYVIYNAPEQFHAQFYRKQNWIQRCQNNNNQ